jgi:hypothetical protein
MILRKLTDWQQEVIDCVKSGNYLEYPNQPTGASTKYQTRTGVDFTWFHSLGDGKGIVIMNEWQPRSVARKIRKYLK